MTATYPVRVLLWSEVPETAHESDHDLLLKCVFGIASILEKLTAAEKRMDGSDTRIEKLDDRVKVLEAWKIRVALIMLMIGCAFGFLIKTAIETTAHAIAGH